MRPSVRLLSRPLSLVIAFLLALGCRGSKVEKKTPPAPTAAADAGPRRVEPSPNPTRPPEPLGPPASALRPARPLNVLFITVDSLRADVPWLGYSRSIAPNLTRLAEESVVYTRAYSASSYTAKSVATMLSGRYASTLYRDYRFFTRYAPANEFLAEVLAEHGATTLAWHGHLYFGRNSGLEQGFSEWQLVPGIKFDPETDNSVTSDKMTALGEELLEKTVKPGKPFFAWAHYMDPHDQYLKHAEAPDFGKKARDRYDSEIWYADYHIGKLLDWAHTQAWWKDTAVIVTADHGEAFGEHGMYKHAFELWEVLVRVPLFIYAPAIVKTRIDVRRSHIDLAPTILDLMRVEIPADFQGSSLVPELYGETPGPREPILVELSEDSHNPPRRAIIQGRYKLIDFGREHYELFNLENDPAESVDLSKHETVPFEEMVALLKKRFGALGSIAPYGGGKLREGGRANGPEGPARR
jgi:arylsulfatase A-like enzyme